MIKTWISDISYLDDENRYRKIYDTLPDFRKDKADRISIQKNKAQSVGVWYLLEVVRSKNKISDKAVFNLSHSGDYVLCSIDTKENAGILLGCDIETIHPVSLKFARRFYCKGEYEHVLSMKSEEEQREELIRYWVLKESFMKATRLGMKLDTRSFEIELKDRPLLLTCPSEFSKEFYFKEYDFCNKAKVAVCCTDEGISDNIDTEFLDLFRGKDET